MSSTAPSLEISFFDSLPPQARQSTTMQTRERVIDDPIEEEDSPRVGGRGGGSSRCNGPRLWIVASMRAHTALWCNPSREYRPLRSRPDVGPSLTTSEHH